MRELVNLQNYENYIDNALNEDLIHGEQSICNRAFLNGGPIEFEDGTSVTPRQIVNAVNEAIIYLNSEYDRTFTFARETLNIIYLAHSNKYKTMAVDKNMNLYLNAGFVYSTLKMDKELIAAVIMHEVFHALFNHIERGTNWLAAQGKARTPQTWHDTNLAADMEVNRMLVKIDLIKEERLVNEIKGIYLRTKSGERDVVTMETILNNEEYMNKLRSMCPPPPDPMQGQQNTIKTTEDWDQGYKDAWNLMARLIKKYGYKAVWQKLQDAGLINSVGEIYKNHDIDEIKGLELLQVKSFDEYISESLDTSSDDKYKTYDDGFVSAFGKVVEKLYKTMNPQPDGDTMDGPQGGDNLESDLKPEDLDQIDLPNQENKKDDKKSNGNGMPENMKNDDSSSDDKQDEGEKSAGDGGSGKDDDDITEDDIDKLADDISKKTNGGEQKVSTSQEISIGGTGSFEEEGATDDDLRDAGYSDEDIAEINKVRKENEKNNSKAKIEKAIEKFKRNLPEHSSLKKCLDAIEIEANKYKNVWKEILKGFMSKNTRRAGNEKPTGHNDWIRKKSIARGEYGVHHQKTSQDPQDLNVYVDVSGSVDMELLEVISKSLVVYTQQFKYSGINICPWATSSNGVYKVEDFYKKNESEVTKEILDIVSRGILQCGGGTDVDAAIDAMIDVVNETLTDKNKRKKDDVHVIITDGYFDYTNVEEKIKQSLLSSTDRADVAEKAPEHTFWMIYDVEESRRKDWQKEIKKGTLVFINSEVVKNNG